MNVSNVIGPSLLIFSMIICSRGFIVRDIIVNATFGVPSLSSVTRHTSTVIRRRQVDRLTFTDIEHKNEKLLCPKTEREVQRPDVPGNVSRDQLE